MDVHEFIAYSDKHFRFLEKEFGFSKSRTRKDRDSNPFKVQYENETTIVIVEGVHYGFGVAVWLISRDPSLMRFRRYDLRDLLSIRCPGYVPPVAKPTDTTNIQKRRIREYAPALKAYARDVLTGDFGIFPELAMRVERRFEEDRYDQEPKDEGREKSQ